MAKLNSCIDHDFAMWAFGDAWLDYLSYDLDTIDLMKVWNERHGDKLMLEPDGNLVGDMGKMKQIWKEYANSRAFHELCWDLMETQTRLEKLEKMDKKMHKVSLKIKDAEKDIKKGKPKQAVKVLKGAEKKNEKL